jgi:hypothetical protein
MHSDALDELHGVCGELGEAAWRSGGDGEGARVQSRGRRLLQTLARERSVHDIAEVVVANEAPSSLQRSKHDGISYVYTMCMCVKDEGKS